MNDDDDDDDDDGKIEERQRPSPYHKPSLESPVRRRFCNTSKLRYYE